MTGHIVFLRDDKVVLRPLCDEDRRDALVWINDPEVRPMINSPFPLTEAEARKWAERIGGEARTDIVFAIEAEGRHVGNLGLHRIEWVNRVASFGIVIGDASDRKKGFGTAAAGLLIGYGFDELNLHRISSTALSINEASLRLHAKLGFVEEGRRREAAFKHGNYVDWVEFGLLRRDWRSSAR